ncbi:hypothetical protein L5515_006483 [Caenorhabditis briggsae]|uniref:Uncharacterized protein n=1 Tax=Caenorhabditis briggsae TaxID=6238 RepID=A0AAE9EW51_CAEBR|nr:hypothetical protein L5515_006483 [Caenorhabditis briggsae]
MDANQDDQMEVDPNVTSQTVGSGMIKLMNTIPRHGHQKEDEMTTQEEAEYLRRKAEDEQIKKWDLKIEALIEKVNTARRDRVTEVIRMNKRRDNYDANIKKKQAHITASESLRERRRIEAKEDEEWRKMRRNRGKKSSWC